MALLLSGCTALAPVGAILYESDVINKSIDGVNFSYYVQVKKLPYGAKKGNLYCRLNSPGKDFDYVYVNAKDNSNWGGVDGSFRFKMSNDSVSEWNDCQQIIVDENEAIISFGGVNKGGCSSYKLNGETLYDGSKVYGTMCSGVLSDGLQIGKGGDIKKCKSGYYERYDTTKKDTSLMSECIQTNQAGDIERLVYYDGIKSGIPHLSWDKQDPFEYGLQVKYKGSSDVNIGFRDATGMVKSERYLDAKILSDFYERSTDKLKYDQQWVAADYDKKIANYESLAQRSKNGPALSKIDQVFGNGSVVEKCYCTFFQCMRMVSNDPSKRLSNEEWVIREKITNQMCIALRKANVIKVDQSYTRKDGSFYRGTNKVVMADGSSGLDIDRVLSYNNLLSLSISGEAGELLREAQQELRDYNHARNEEKRLKIEKERILAQLRRNHEDTLEQKRLEALRKNEEKRRITAEKAKEDLKKFKACVARFGLNYDERENWSVVPQDCV